MKIFKNKIKFVVYNNFNNRKIINNLKFKNKMKQLDNYNKEKIFIWKN